MSIAGSSAPAGPGAASAWDGSLSEVEFRRDPYFDFQVPISVPGVEQNVLSPLQTWNDEAAFAETTARLVDLFHKTFQRFAAHVDADMHATEPMQAVAA